MICPYCSIDIEPIELNGKTFCSNCGLAISAPTVTQNHETLDNHPLKTEVEDEPKPDATQNAWQPQRPITEESIKEILQDDQVTNPTIEENSTDETLDPVSPKTIESTDTAPAPTISEPITNQTPMDTDLENAPQDNLENSVDQNNDTKETPILMDILQGEPQADTADQPPIPENYATFDDSVKNIDQLGTAGILLDILSDEQEKKQTAATKEVLEAAEDLVEKIHISSDDNQIKGAAEFTPKDAIKLKVGVLDDSPVNPVTHPELEAGPEELDLPLPTEEETDKSSIEPEFETPQNTETINAESDIKTFEDLLNSKRSVNSYETNEIDDAQDTSHSQTIEEVDEPNVTLEDLPEAQESEAEIPQTSESSETETSALETPTDPQVIPEQIENNSTDEPEEKFELHEKPVAQILSAQKSEHLRDYFSNIVSFDHEKVKNTKKKKHKNSKSKSKSTSKFIFSNLITIFIIIFVVLAAFGGMYFVYSKNDKKVPEIPRDFTEQPKFEANEPKEIPYGYQKSKTSYDPDNSAYTVVYTFISDENRTLTFRQINSGNLEVDLKELINTKNGKFESKTIDEQNYTIFEDGTIYWARDNFVYAIDVQGETFKELIEKMAQSVNPTTTEPTES